jgi:hypothetical protein
MMEESKGAWRHLVHREASMRIEAVDPRHHPFRVAPITGASLTAPTAAVPAPTIEPASPAPAPRPVGDAAEVPPLDESIPEASLPPNRGDGVLRLLESGHFKGVADVRLRINFFEELSARTQALAAPVVASASDELVAAVRAQADELVAAFATTDELRAASADLVTTFEAAVQGIVTQSADGAAIDPQSISSALQSAFDSLVQSLTELLTPVEPEPEVPADSNGGIAEAEGSRTEAAPISRLLTEASPVPTESTLLPVLVDDPPAAEDPSTPDVGDGVADGSADPTDEEPLPNLADSLAAFQEAFAAALSSFVTSLETAVTLPDPAPYTGNGRAYAKFLAIYDDLRGLTPAVDETA